MIPMRLSARSLLSLLVVLFALLGSLPVRADESPSFAVGERLTYSIRWGILKAGTAVLEVHPITEIDGEEVFHFSLSIRTTSLVDHFYKVRDRIDGFARTDLEGSVLYLVKKEAGDHLRDVRVTYDLNEGWAQYSNFGEEEEPVEITPGTLDPLSVLFALREMPLKKGSEVELPISDGKRVTTGIGHVRAKKKITVPAGNYKTILVEPDMKDVGGVFDKSGDSPLQVFFSDDERQLPVRIASEVAVGSFQADLVSIEQVPLEEQEELASIDGE